MEVAEDGAAVRVLGSSELHASRPIVLEADPAWLPHLEREFGDLRDLDRLPDGRIALLDGIDARVVVTGPGGRVYAEFGRRGQGPGEFDPAGLSSLIVTDTSILVPDLTQQRIIEFDPAGELIESVRIPGEGKGAYALDWRAHPDGGLAFRVLRPEGDVLLRLGHGGLDTLYTFPTPARSSKTMLPSVAVWDLSAHMLVTGLSTRWEIAAREPEGGLLWRVRRPGVQGFTDDDREHVVDLLVASAARKGIGEPTPSERELLLADLELPPHVPQIAELRLAPTGHVWVQRASRVSEMGVEAMRIGSARGYGSPVWDVLDRRGEPVATVELPPRFSLRRIGPSWLFGILTDEFGIQSPARVRLPGL